MDPAIKKMVEDFVKKYDAKAVWQVDVQLMELAKEIEKYASQNATAFLSEALNSGDGVYRP